MRRIWTAIRAFFATLFSGDTAARVEQLLLTRAGPQPLPLAEKPAGESAPAETKPKPLAAVPKPAPPKAVRSEAVTLLAALQREARFVDFIQESLDDYSDEQVGAAARDVHRQCRAIIERMFGLKPIVSDAEGAAIDVPAGFDAGKYRLTGRVAGQAPFRGQLAHHGWEAAKCDLPSWSGSKDSALIVTPAEVEVK
jgi:Domain of unknown function (DUF2760)